MKIDFKNKKNIWIAVLSGLLLISLLWPSRIDGPRNQGTAEERLAQIWTCAMHPQIQMDEPGLCPICGMDLISLKNEEEMTNTSNLISLSKSALKMSGVMVSTVSRRLPEKKIHLFGHTEIDNRLRYTQAAHFSGRIEKVNREWIGSTIQKGDIIAEIYSPELIAAQRELIEAYSVKKHSPRLYEAARRKMKAWKISDKKIVKIETTGKLIEGFPILSDYNGTVASLNISAGTYVRSGDRLLDIIYLDPISAVFEVYESDIRFIQLGAEIKVKSRTRDKILHAKIERIDPQMVDSRRIYYIRGRIKNPDGYLRAGQLLDGIINGHLADRSPLISIPKSAVLWTGKRSVVYVQEPEHEGHFEMREIMLGQKMSDHYVVLSGLQEGEKVVTAGTFTIDAAAQLSGLPSMMNRADKEGEPGALLDQSIVASNDFLKHLNTLVDTYLILKDALVRSDAVSAQKIASEMDQTLGKMKTIELQKEERAYLAEPLKYMTLQSSSIASTDDIEKQRRYFKPFSHNLTEMIKTFGGIKQKIFVQFCPMAFDNEGGYWLSREGRIANPYFGDAMLRCGSVKDTLYTYK